MTIWSQFLPGVRDTRLPLAVGSLWIVTGVLLFRYLPDGVSKGPLAGSIRAVAAQTPGPVLVGTALFGSYLLGIALTEICRIAVRLAQGVINLVPVVFLLLLMVLLFERFLGLILLGAGGLAAVVWYRSRAVGELRYLDLLSQVMTSVVLWYLRFCDHRWQDLKAAWDPSREQIAVMVREEAARTLASADSVRAGVVDRIPARMLEAVVRAVNLQETDFQRFFGAVGAQHRSVTLKGAVRRAKKHPDLGAIVRAAVEAKVAANADARNALVRTVVNTTRLQVDIRNRIDRAHVQLSANHQAVYNEYDRLRSEAEFRTGTALPLAALLAALGFVLADDLKIGDSAVWFYLAAGATGIAMLTAGDGKRSEAANLLYSAVRQQLVGTEARTYGLEYFPIKHAGVEIDLELFRPVTERASRLGRWLGSVLLRLIRRRKVSG